MDLPNQEMPEPMLSAGPPSGAGVPSEEAHVEGAPPSAYGTQTGTETGTNLTAIPAMSKPEDVLFAFFADDGFFCETSTGWYHAGLPSGLKKTVQEDVARGRWIASGADNSYSYRFIGKDGKPYAAWRRCPHALEAELDVPRKHGRVVKVSLGQHVDDYYVGREDGSAAWVASTSVVVWIRELKARLGPPEFLALGKNSSAVAIFRDETATKDVPDRLYRAITEADSPIRFITLSPFNSDHFFCQFESGAIAYSVSAKTYECLRDPLAEVPKVLAHMSKKITRGPAPYRMHSGVEPQPSGAQNVPPPPQPADGYAPPPPDGYIYSPPLADGAPSKGGMPFPPSGGQQDYGGNQYYVNQGGYQPQPQGGRYSPMPAPPPQQQQQQYYAPPRPGYSHQGSSFHMQNQGGPYAPVNGYAPQGPYGVDYPAHGGPPGKEKTKTSRFSSAGSRYR